MNGADGVSDIKQKVKDSQGKGLLLRSGAHGSDRPTGHRGLEEQGLRGIRLNHVTIRFVVLAVAIGIASIGSASADENVRAGWAEQNVRTVQEKLRNDGFYLGEIRAAW